MKNTKHSKSEYLFALLLAAIVFCISISSVDHSCVWGDDFAAYINEGIAIADGNLAEQSKVFYYLHPAPLTSEASNGELIYAWGFPLILSGIYRIVGYDRLGFSSILYYKIPAIICFSALAGILYLFYRRRFGKSLSVLLTVALCSFSSFFNILNNVMTDLVFLFLTVCSFYLSESKPDSDSKFVQTLFCFLFGVILWLTYEVRLNGILVIILCLLNAFAVSKNSSEKQPAFFIFLPFALCLLFVFSSERLFLMPATGELSSVGKVSPQQLLLLLSGYLRDIDSFFQELVNNSVVNPVYSVLKRAIPGVAFNYKAVDRIATTALVLLLLAGIIRNGFKDNLHLTLFIFILVLGSSLYFHDSRYIYPAFPFILMYIGYGLSWLKNKLHIISKHVVRIAEPVICGILCAFLLFPPAKNAALTDLNDNSIYGAFSDEAKNAYTYIIENTGKDDIIAFFRPRCLYLNTQRLSFVPGMNGHSIDEADYFLRYKYEGELFPPDDSVLSPMFESDSFIFYSIKK